MNRIISRSKQTVAFVVMIVMLISLNNTSIAFAEAPSVVSYEIKAPVEYIDLDSGFVTVAAIVSFDSLENLSIDANTTYAEVNIDNEGGPHRLFLIESGQIDVNGLITASANQMIFSSQMETGFNYLHGSSERNMIKIEKIVINGVDIIINSEPTNDDKVYFDGEQPRYSDIKTIESKDIYNFEDPLKIEMTFDEPVVLATTAAFDEAIKLKLTDQSNNEYIYDFSEIEGLGTNTVLLTHYIEDIVTQGAYTINLIMDYQDFSDLAGNTLIWDINNKFYEVLHDTNNDQSNDLLIVDSAHPIIDYQFSDNNRMSVSFFDNKHDITKFEIGAYLTKNAIDSSSVKNLDYNIVPINDNLIYDDYFNKLYFRVFYDDITDVSNQDSVWHMYYYIQDEDNNRLYVQKENIQIDRLGLTLSVEDIYQIPLSNQAIIFDFTGGQVNDLYITIEALDNTSIASISRNFSDGFYMTVDQYNQMDQELQFEIMENTRLKGDVDVVKVMGQQLGLNHVDTDTYVFKITGNDGEQNSSDLLIRQFTLDRTPPVITISDEFNLNGRLTGYKINVSDINGLENTQVDASLYNKSYIKYCFSNIEEDYSVPTQNAMTINLKEDVIIPIDYSSLSEGTYRLNIIASDYAANATTQQSITTFKSIDAPVGVLDSEPYTNDYTLRVTIGALTQYDNAQYRYWVIGYDDEKSQWIDVPSLNNAAQVDIDLGVFSDLSEEMKLLFVEYKSIVEGVSYISAPVIDGFVYDTTGPELDIQYSTEAVTFEPVTAQLVIKGDNFSGPHEISVLTDTSKVLYTSSEQYIFKASDMAGNISIATAQATWISNDVKPATVIYDTLDPTSGAVTVYLDFLGMDNNQALVTLDMSNVSEEAVSVTTKGINTYYTFNRNGEYGFNYVDNQGKAGQKTAYISNIDREKPTGKISYNISEQTNKDVKSEIFVDEDVKYEIYNHLNQIITSGSAEKGTSIRYTFTNNHLINVHLIDDALNSNDYAIEVSWIDKTAPIIGVQYSNNYFDIETKDPITVTLSANEAIEVLNNYQKATKTFNENEKFTFRIQDLAGNTVEETVDITNIDSSGPELSLTYSATTITNQDVLVTLESDEPITVLNNNNSKDMLISKNGDYFFKIEDSKQNIIYYNFSIDNIDKTAPQIFFKNGENIFINQGNSQLLIDDVIITDNEDGLIESYTTLGSINYDVPGQYKLIYNYSDSAGNTGTFERLIEVVELGNITLVINNEKMTGDVLQINGGQVNIDIYGAMGNYELLYKYGTNMLGKFKKNKQEASEDGLEIKKTGYYTFFVMDQERNVNIAVCYIVK